MALDHLSNLEVAQLLAARLRAWRQDERGASMSQAQLAARAGIGLTPLRRFESTGGTTLTNLIAMMRALGLLDRLEELVPDPQPLTPMELLLRQRRQKVRKHAKHRFVAKPNSEDPHG